MVNGSYQVKLRTPLGVKKGELVLQSQGDVLTGRMIVMGKENEIGPGTVDGDAFRFEGTLKTAVGELAYVCSGSVRENELTGTVKTRKSDMPLSGARM